MGYHLDMDNTNTTNHLITCKHCKAFNVGRCGCGAARAERGEKLPTPPPASGYDANGRFVGATVVF